MRSDRGGSGSPARSRRRWGRRLAFGVIGLGIVVLAAWAVLESAWTEERVRRVIVDRAAGMLAGDLQIDRLSGSVFGDLVLSGVSLTLEGEPVLTAETIRVRFRPWVLVRQRAVILTSVTVEGLDLTVAEDARGWNVGRLTRPTSPAAPPTAGRAFDLDTLELTRGTVEIRQRDGQPRRLESLEMTARLSSRDGRLRVELVEAAARDTATDVAFSDLAATLTVGPEQVAIDGIRVVAGSSRLGGRFALPRREGAPAEFAVEAESLPAGLVQAYAPALSMLPEAAVIEGSATGTTSAFDATVTVRSPEGVVAGTTHATFEPDVWRFGGRADITDWTPAAWFSQLADLRPLDAEGTYEVTVPDGALDRSVVAFDVASPDVRYAAFQVTGARARGSVQNRRISARASGRAYGARVTADTRWDGDTGRITAEGRVDGADLRRLPPTLGVPALESALSGTYTLGYAAGIWDVTTHLDESLLEGATVRSGATGSLHLTPGAVRYTAQVDVTGLETDRLAVLLPDQAETLRQLGGLVNAAVDLDAGGASIETLAGTVDAYLTDSRVAGVAVDHLRLSGSLVDHRLEAVADGRLRGELSSLGFGAAAPDEPITGTADVHVDVQIPNVTTAPLLEALTGSARVTLADVSARGRTLAHLALEGTLAEGRLTVESFEVDDPAMAGTAVGSVVLAGSGRSDLTLELTLADLSTAGALVGQSLGGSALLSGRVTGTAARLEIAGTVSATALRADEVGAAAVSGTFSATVPEFDVARATGRLEATGKDVDIGGRRFDEVRSRVAYDGEALDIDARLSQGARSLDLAGLLRLRPDDYEAVVRRLTLTDGDQRWALADGRIATIRYGIDRLTVAGLVVEHDGAELAVAGTHGPDRADALSVTAANIDLAALGPWLPGAPALTGRLDGEAVLTGSRGAPQVDGRLQVADGSVNDVGYRALAATGRYADAQLTLDARLDAGPVSNLTIAGTMPLAFDESGRAETPFDLTLRSTDVDLAGLGPWLPGAPALTGRLDGEAVLTGSRDEPRLDGRLRVADGSVNGVGYRALTATGRYADAQLTLDARLDAGPVSNLTIAGTIPLAFDESGQAETPFDVTVQSTDVDLGFFQPVLPQVENLRGTGRIDLRMTGRGPDIDGSMSLSDATFRIPATGVTYRRVTADLSVAGQELTVRELRLEDGEGQVARVAGTVNVPGVGPPNEFELRVVANRFRVLNNELGEVGISADLQVMGDLTTPLMVGTITVDRGRIEASRLLDRLNAGGESTVTGADDTMADDPLGRSSVSITLDLPDNVVVRGRDLVTGGGGPVDLGDINVTVGGALSIAKEVGEPPRVLGRMNVVRGQYLFQGRAFTIARGSSVQFRGDPADPSLDIDAERTISGVVATVRVTGSPEQLEIVLSSRPPLDQGDILSLIVFNQSMNRLPTDQRVSLAARAGALAAGAIAAPIADSVARALDLDQFDIRQADTGGGASLLVGRQVSQRLFVGFRHDFGDADVSQVSFEYRLTEFLRIVTSLAQGGGRADSARRAEAAGFDLIFVVR